jgi:hypothetical protein
MILAEKMGLKSAPVQQDWGTVPEDLYRQRSEEAKEVMRLYRNLPVNTVFVAQERDHNPPKTTTTTRSGKVITRTLNKLAGEYTPLETGSYLASDMGAATVKWMHDACDYICRLSIDKEVKTESRKNEVVSAMGGKDVYEVETFETGRQVRRIRTMYHPNIAAGFRSENPEAVPEYIEAVTPREMYEKVMKVIKGEKLLAK